MNNNLAKAQAMNKYNEGALSLRARSEERRLLKAQLRARKIRHILTAVICIALLYFCINTVAGTIQYVTNLQDTVTELENQVTTLNKYSTMYNDTKVENLQLRSQIDELNKTITDLSETIQTCDSNIEQLKTDNISINETNKSLSKQLKKTQNKLKTYEKYEYAVFDSGCRTDLTYDEIKLGEKLMEEKGYDPNILFAIGMVESGYDRTCTSSISTAKGYHQFLDGTAKFTYETLLKNGKGSWTPSVAYDGKTNIKMCVAYFDYLMNKHGDFYKAMGQYCGAGTSKGSFTYTYISRMNKYSSKVGINMYDIIDNMKKG